MKISTYAVAAITLLASADAFLPSNKPTNVNRVEYKVGIAKQNNNRVPMESSGLLTRTSTTSIQMASFLDNLPNPLKSLTGDGGDNEVTPRPPNTPPPLVSNEAEALFSRARAIVAADLGLSDPTFLSEDFEWVGPNVISTGKLSKSEYLAAGKFFNLRSAFPDLDYRAHDFRLDPKDPLTVRFTARTVGTMRGELRLRGKDNQGEVIQPNGVRMVCPPEVISITFDANSGKVTKLCSGFVMDRLVGNTGGLAGVQGAATVAGRPPSEWEIYPPSAVLSRFFGRSVKQLEEPSKVFLAPFPETVMIQLAKGVLAAELGTEDPDLLGESFTFCGPIVGPLKKDEFLEGFSSFKIRDAFPDLEENYSNFRVDPYDPYRVWFDTKSEGTWTGPLAGQQPTGAKYIGPPEVSSMTFDDDGFCIRLTAGAVADPTECNTGGLGGVFGIFYATGNALPSLSSRPLPQIISRLQTSVLSPFTGKNADDFMSVKPVSSTTEIAPKPPAPPVPEKIVTPESFTPAPPVVEKKKSSPIEKLPTPPVAEKPAVVPSPPTKVEKKSAISPQIDEDPADPVSDVFSSFFGGGKSDVVESKSEPKAEENIIEKQKAKLRAQAEERQKAAEEKKAAAEQKRKEAEEARMKAAEAKKAEADEKRAVAEQKKREAEEAKLKTAEEKRALAEQKRKEAEEARLRSAEEKRAAAEQKRKEAEEARARAAEERKAAAEQKKQEAEEARQRMIEERKAAEVAKKQAAEEKRKEFQQKINKAQAEKKIASAPKGATISLGFFGFGKKNDGEGNVVNVPKPAATGAPRGVPSLTKWTQNNDGSITGLISGSNAFPDGESITTSRIKTENPDGDSLVVTVSGSRYYLDGKAAASGFSFFGRRPAKSEPEAPAAVEDAAAAKKKRMEEQKAAAAAKKAELESARKAKQEEAKRIAAEKKAQIEAKKEEARLKREASVQAQKEKAAAAKLAGKSRSGTISLQPDDTAPSFFSFGKKADNKAVKPPAGVPVINKFKQNRDGSITGFITGSASFREGERITTSKLAPKQKIEAGSVVTTVSGSKYFLK